MSPFERYLVESGLILSSELDAARALAESNVERLPATLRGMSLLDDDDLFAAMRATTPTAVLAPERIEPDLTLGAVNPAFLFAHAVCPLGSDEGRLVTAMADPGDDVAASGLRFATGLPVSPRLARRDTILAALARSLPAVVAEVSPRPSAARQLRTIVERGRAAGATAIRLEPAATGLVIRARIDGRMIAFGRAADEDAGPLLARIAAMIAERGAAGAARFGAARLFVAGQTLSLTIARTPTTHGDDVLVRLPSWPAWPVPDAPALAMIRDAIGATAARRALIVVGPRDSGRTTTLVAALAQVRRDHGKVVVVGDPLDPPVDDVLQVAVGEAAEWSEAVRTALRHDPDVLLIDDLPDAATVALAVRAAREGRVVLAAVAASDGGAALAALGGFAPEAIVEQRLVRAVCGDCRTSQIPVAAQRALFDEAHMAAPEQVPMAHGCARCNETGYRGRIMIAAPAHDAHLLWRHGLALVADGRTTLAALAELR